MKTATHIIIICFLALCVAGCTSSACVENRNSIPLAGFYDAESGKQIALDSLAIGGIGAPDDSLLTRSAAAISTIYLPLRSQYHTASFFIRYLHSYLAEADVTDTISLTYTSTPYFASEECGAMYRYLITECRYTRNIVDSVAIIDSLITNIDVERIRIFFRTTTNPAEGESDE